MRKSKAYRKWYGVEYVPKTMTPVRRCLKCGRETPMFPGARKECSSCGGDLVVRYVVRKTDDQKVQKHRQKPLKT